MRLKSEDEILKPEVRQQIIDEIEGAENKRRKAVAYKRHEIWKNRSKDFVRELLAMQLDPSTVREMEYCLSNISIARKIVDKLARVYANGVIRKYENDAETEALSKLEKKLQINSQMKTANKLLKLQRNAALYCKPVEYVDKEGEKKWCPAWIPMSPHLYDVVEMENDRTKPMVYVLSNFERSAMTIGLDQQRVPELAASHKIQAGSFKGDGVDQKIADKKEDEGEDLERKKTYIWWTDKYHFTTLGAEIINPNTGMPDPQVMVDDLLNPIDMMPFVDLHIDQEGHYWAEGGDDLIDGDLLLNCMLTNAHHIGVTQGYGQLVMIGEDLPQTVKLGPNKTINLPLREDGPSASAEFLTASPPLDGLASQVEMYLALLLTTNNLSTTGVASNLQGGITAPSGIALAIDKAESLEDVQDQRDIFLCAEEKAFKITAEWLQYFDQEGDLSPEFDDCRIPVDRQPVVEFRDAMLIMSEKEKLENIRLREELGINSKVELIMKDRGVSEREAEEILLKLTEEKLKKMVEQQQRLQQMGMMPDEDEQPPEDAEADDNADDDGKSNRANEVMKTNKVASQEQIDKVNQDDALVDKNIALNGAQVSSLLEVIEKVTNDQLPRESAVQILSVAFNMEPSIVEQMMGKVGKGFKPKVTEGKAK